MNVLEAIVLGPNSFRGSGVNEEDEKFTGELLVQTIEGGRAALLKYVAVLESGKVVHTESTLIGTGKNGKLCLWPVMSEIPVVLRHVEISSAPGPDGELKSVFSSGPRDDQTSFREEITIQIFVDRTLRYAHAWGLPGGAFEERSSCSMASDAA